MKYTNKEWKELFKRADESELSTKQWCLKNKISYGAYKVCVEYNSGVNY